MVGNIGPAYCTKVYGIIGLQLLQAVRWHIPSSLEIVFAAPVKGIEVEFKAANGLGENVEDLDGGFCYVDSDSVTWNAGYAVYVCY